MVGAVGAGVVGAADVGAAVGKVGGKVVVVVAKVGEAVIGARVVASVGASVCAETKIVSISTQRAIRHNLDSMCMMIVSSCLLD